MNKHTNQEHGEKSFHKYTTKDRTSFEVLCLVDEIQRNLEVRVRQHGNDSPDSIDGRMWNCRVFIDGNHHHDETVYHYDRAENAAVDVAMVMLERWQDKSLVVLSTQFNPDVEDGLFTG